MILIAGNHTMEVHLELFNFFFLFLWVTRCPSTMVVEVGAVMQTGGGYVKKLCFFLPAQSKGHRAQALDFGFLSCRVRRLFVFILSTGMVSFRCSSGLQISVCRKLVQVEVQSRRGCVCRRPNAGCEIFFLPSCPLVAANPCSMLVHRIGGNEKGGKRVAF